MKILFIGLIISISNISFSQNLQSFIPLNYEIFDSLSFDFNEDKISDKILILERVVNDEDSFSVQSKRPFLILQGIGNSKYKLKLRNDNIILDAQSGGMYGDPYQGMNADNNSIGIFHHGGTSWRWDINDNYIYNKEKDTWYLINETTSSFWLFNIDSTYTEEIKNFTEKDTITIENYYLEN